MRLPTESSIQRLHKKYAPSRQAYEDVFSHCVIVNVIANQLINSSPIIVNVPLIKVGCLLHDIGVYQLYDVDGEIDKKNYIKHGVIGYEILKQEGFEEAICRFASHHTGVGLAKREIEQEHLPLPPKDYLAQNREERLVMYADKFISKWPDRFNAAETYKEHLAKFGAHKVKTFDKFMTEFGMPNLELLSRQFELPIA